MLEKFKTNSKKTGSYLCIGLDTNAAKAPVSDFLRFNKSIIDATAEYAACFKFQLAFYEEHGKDGLALLENTIMYIRNQVPQMPIIGDAKRCDVGHSAAAYARALYRHWGFDCVTLLPYLGADAISPFLQYDDKSAFVVCHTSNPSAKYIQQLSIQPDNNVSASEMQLYEYVAQMIATLDPNNKKLGAVVGATYPGQITKLRQQHPKMMFLIPGVGTQGGNLEQVVAGAIGADECNFLINVSRAIIYASDTADNFEQAAANTARYFKDAINLAVAKKLAQ